MEFWERVNSRIKELRVTQAWVADQTGISLNTIRSEISKNISPTIAIAYPIAVLLDVPLEVLIAGEDGERFVLLWAGRNGVEWKPPERLEAIIKHLERISDRDLHALEAMAKTYAREPEEDAAMVAERGVDFEDLAAAYGTWEQGDVRYIPEKPKPKKKKKDDEKAG